MTQATSSRVLCVDLDGTLVATDLLWESLVSVLRRAPWLLLSAPIWLFRGRACLKQKLADAAAVDFATLPYRTEVLTFVTGEHRRGRRVVLATAADHSLATGVSKHLGIFFDVIASDGVTNLKGRAKAASLSRRFGAGNFDYIGNGRADIPCWECAAEAITTTSAGSARVPNLRTLDAKGQSLTSQTLALLKALRPHQWLKNLLIFVPVLAAHTLNRETGLIAALAFASFSLCASGGYVLNDLLDVTADRLHARKRARPFASGQLSISTGVFLVLATWIAGFGTAVVFLPRAFVLIVAIYLMTTAAYSIRIKREPVLDIMVLAGLYVIRVLAGGVAGGIPVSTWLLAVTLFVSLSLAFLKRFIEISEHQGQGVVEVSGRGYRTDDAAWLHSVGLSSAFLATVVLAIYANNADIVRLYSHPERLLLICPLLLYWASRTWLKAHRHEMHDDPVVAVALDPVTYVIAAIGAAVVLSAV